MKKILIINLLLMLMAFTSNAQNAAIENIMSRTSIRAYEAKSVESEKLTAILQSAMAAPSAGNKQPWEFVVVTDKTTLENLAQCSRPASMVASAPLAIVVCGDTNNVFGHDGKDYWVQDVSAASENILLAAHSLGLGAVWCGLYPIQERVEKVQKVLNLPPHVIPLNIIPIGYPKSTKAPMNKWNESKVHTNKW